MHLILLAINTGSRSQRTSFNSGDHFAVKRPVTITSSASKKELKFSINKHLTSNIAFMNSSCPSFLGNIHAIMAGKKGCDPAREPIPKTHSQFGWQPANFLTIFTW